MKSYAVRKAIMGDLESIKLLFDELTMSDLPYDKHVNKDWSHTKEGIEYFTRKILENNGVCFVAEANSNIVGYCTSEIADVPSYRLVKVAALENLVVSRSYRGQGIGKQLVDAFIRWAKSKGAQKVSVNVFTGNTEGTEFYLHNGFTHFETILEQSI